MAGIDESDRQLLVDAVRRFVDREVIPTARELEHADRFPDALVARMRELGLFAATIPERYGGLGLDFATYALLVEELCRGWMSLGGILNTHVIVAYLLAAFGSEEQRARLLPRLAEGELRAGLAISEAEAGSDVQAIATTARRAGDEYVVDGAKLWVTNGRRAGLVAVLVRTDPAARPPHRGMSVLLVERETPGLGASRTFDKLGYKGVETAELVFAGARVPAANLLGGREGDGFKQAMSGLEVGRINVAARAVGLARAAFEDAIRYAQRRRTFGRPIAEHQAIQLKLADMATRIEAARLLTRQAAERKDAGGRCDLEAGMAKLFATEMCQEVTLEALRIHGGFGYTTELDVERYYRDAPFMLVAEGTSEIQRLVIARELLRRYAVQQ
jgi:alkylation response protein AidB-like acyl-CoA dehydrogenase